MKVTNVAIKMKTAVFVMVFILTVAGLVAYNSLPRESFPAINQPIITVMTVYVGVAPGDIESLVTQKIEKELKEIQNVDKITSISKEGFSSITVVFEPDVDVNEALQKVRDKVNIAKPELPRDAEEPEIIDFDFANIPIMLVNVSADYGLIRLKDVAEDLQDEIEKVPGVAQVQMTGDLVREVKVDIDLGKLKYYNVAFDDIIEKVQQENTNIPGGSIDVGKINYLVRVNGEFVDPTSINDMVISTVNGKPIYFKDIGNVEYGFKERTSYSREDGTECITLSIKKRTGANIVEIADRIKVILAEAAQTFPKGTSYSILQDQSKDIRRMVNELENNIISGLILVVLVLLFFMGVRNAMLVAIAIPLSMFMSFLVIAMLGYTLNMMVLFSLILALGMLVDNAIVIIENIYRHREEGKELLEAAKIGTAEVGVPVITSTITTLCAFGPMLFWTGIVGEFMKFLPITLIITLACSLFVALIINPVFCSVFVKVTKSEEGTVFAWVKEQYRRFLIVALNRRITTLVLSFVLLVLALVLYGVLGKGVVFFPDLEPTYVFVNVTAPIGTTLEESNRIVKEVEKEVLQFLITDPKLLPEQRNVGQDIKSIVANVGYTTDDFGASGSASSHKSRLTIEFIDREERTQSSYATMENIREAVSQITGARIDVDKPDDGPPTGKPINVEISGKEFESLGALAREVREKIKDIAGMVNLQDDFDKGRPEINVEIDREKAAIYGLNTQKIATTIRTAVNGNEASKFRISSDEYDIVVRLKADEREFISDLDNLVIFEEGIQVPLVSFANLKVTSGLGSIRHKDLDRVVNVFAEVEGVDENGEKYQAPAVLAKVQERLKGFKLPPGYDLRFTGQNEEQDKSSDFLLNAFFAAVMLIFLVLVTQFNSVLKPAIIMMCVLLSLIGVFIGLMMTGTPFGIIMTGIGVISLAGVVVNNAIVLIDYIQQMQTKGMSRRDAIIEGGLVRLRPVILTAITTILGLVPLTVGFNFDFISLFAEGDPKIAIGGESSQWWSSMGVAVIFGLGFATILTLVVVPVMYSITDRMAEATSRFFKRKPKLDPKAEFGDDPRLSPQPSGDD